MTRKDLGLFVIFSTLTQKAGSLRSRGYRELNEEPLKSLSCRHDRDTIKVGEIKYIESQKYPRKSTDDKFCRWTLRTTPGAYIRLNFDVLDVSCSYDVNGFFIDDQGITSAAICGKDRQYYSIYSSRHQMEVTFNARSSEVRYSMIFLMT